MPPLQLASTGDDVRLWSLSSTPDGLIAPTTPHVQSRPHRGSVTGVLFNHNNSVLVTCGDDGHLSLQYATGAPLFTLPLFPSSPPLPPLTCLALTSGSRYVACGDSSSRLTIWDLKRQSINRTLEGHTTGILCLDLSPPSSPAPLHIASGSASADVLLHNLDTGHLRHSFTLPSLEPVRSLHYSPHRPTLLACGGDDGHLHLYDLTASTLTSPFTAPTQPSPLSSVLFSPVHPSLLLSASLSSSLTFHDLSSPSPVHRLSTSSPITCADWADDGHHVILGCHDGSLHLFDARSTAHHLAVWKAHDSHVRSVKCHHSLKPLPAASSRGRLRETPSSTADGHPIDLISTPSSALSSSSSPYTAEADRAHSRPASKSEGGGVSPRGVPVTPYVPHSKPYSALGVAAKEPAISTRPPPSSSTASAAPAPAVGRTARASTFSHTPSQTVGSVAPSPTLSPSGRRPPLSPERVEASPLRSALSRSPAARRSSFPAPAPFASTILPSSSASSSRRATMDEVGVGQAALSGLRAVEEEEMKVPHAGPKSTVIASAEAASGASLQAVEAMMERRLSSLYTAVHTDLVNLQLDSMRQFHAQSQEWSALVQALMADNAALREEVGHMREEMRHLRM